MCFDIESAEATARMGKKVYEAMRAIEGEVSGNEQLLFEACYHLDRAIEFIKKLPQGKEK